MMLACLCLGLLAGGMLVIGVVFVRFWKSLSPSDFQTWFALVACWSGPATRRGGLLVAALSAIGVMVTYPIFFAGTNKSFVRGGLSDSTVRSLLDRWATWHWIRMGLGAVGFIAALRALQRS